jgi:hypothetical protein
MNLDTGKADLIVPLDTMAAKAFPAGIPSTNHFYIFREGWNPSGTRFVTFLKDLSINSSKPVLSEPMDGCSLSLPQPKPPCLAG